MANPQSPHDALFKKVFANPAHSAEALRTALPPQVAQRIDWRSLDLVPGSFVDEHLVSSHSDLLFNATIDHGPGLIYCLFEHQSSVDRWMPVRLLKYVVRILDRHIETANEGYLPIVLPVVLHHSLTGWTASTSLQDLFGPVALDPAFAPFVPHFAFAIDDLSDLTDQALKQRAWSAFPTLAAWVLRDARHGDKWVISLPFWADSLAALSASPHGRDALVVILSYLYAVNEHLPDHIQDAITRHVPAIKDIAMTAAEQLIARGKLEGKIEGKLEGEAIALTEILQAKFGVLSPYARTRIAAADEPSLKRWIVRAAIGSSVDFVFADS